MANDRFFTNTYITGSGRTNYFTIKDLEDPLFTSFTFDIDFNTSPLFYTIKPYTLKNNGLSELIENALETMYGEMSTKDQGYDILPLMSSGFLVNGHKLGFGIQQNVYLDQPLYGATEYIYMVDKRNGGSDQNDVRYGNGGTLNEYIRNSKKSNVPSNSYKLGDSVKNIVNESDEAWAAKQRQQNDDIKNQCDAIMDDETIRSEHDRNKMEMDAAKSILNDIKGTVNGEYYTESELQSKITELKKNDDEFNNLKRDIVNWANNLLSKYQNDGNKIYINNKSVKEIFSCDYLDYNTIKIKEEYLKKNYTNYKNEISTYVTDIKNLYNKIKNELLTINGDNIYIPYEKIQNNLKTRLANFNIKANILIYPINTPPDWATKLYTHLMPFGDNTSEYKDVDNMIQDIMSYKCDIELSFGEDFTSDKIKNNEELLIDFETELDNIKFSLYGTMDNNDYDKSNPDPNSPYAQYIAAKEKYENDEYSQAEKAGEISWSGFMENSQMISDYNNQRTPEYYNQNNTNTDSQPTKNTSTKQSYTPQTVLDILGFISGMKQMITDYPYIIQGITGLDTAYNKHYGIKDPYLGSGEDKITLTCLESLDLRVSSMFNRYFNAIYDRQYRRERVPVNLRRFNCSVYVHDVRNFVSNMRNTENRILELKDMYYSVIEFKFYDCEIVPEETGNIFNDISNEAPSEMKKTNFTFTYGNCVVNFNPSFYELVRHNQHIFWE